VSIIAPIVDETVAMLLRRFHVYHRVEFVLHAVYSDIAALHVERRSRSARLLGACLVRHVNHFVTPMMFAEYSGLDSRHVKDRSFVAAQLDTFRAI
jgi:hypothetical protein